MGTFRDAGHSPKLHQATGSEGLRSPPNPQTRVGLRGGHRRAPCPPGGLRESPPAPSPPRAAPLLPSPTPCAHTPTLCPPHSPTAGAPTARAAAKGGGGPGGAIPYPGGINSFYLRSRDLAENGVGEEKVGMEGRRSKSETYLSEFCAHQDEKEEGQELACRLHVSHPALGTLHADRLRSSRRASLCRSPSASLPPRSPLPYGLF